MGEVSPSPSSPLRIVMVPWLAFGHMIPYFELSKSIAKRGHDVTFISTPRNIARLPPIPPSMSHLFRFVSLPLPPSPDLPEGAEASTDLRPDQVPFLSKAYDALQPAISEYLHTVSPKPDWVVHDFFPYWLPATAAEVGVPCAFFSIFRASIHAFFGSSSHPITNVKPEPEKFTTPPEWIQPSSNLAFRPHEAKQQLALFQKRASGISVAERFDTILRGVQFIAIRSCTELESEWLALLQEKLFQKPVIPVGLLPPTRVEDRSDATPELFDFLDKHSPRSVVYIAFGSEAELSVNLLHELAHGLELAKRPFVWALRKPAGVLPEGFESRTGSFGIVAGGWVPQIKILGHPAVGFFFTHCGCISVIEGLGFGLPLVMLPLAFEQGLTARVLVKDGVGVEVERNAEDGSFTREDVAKAVRSVAAGDGGKVFRDNAEKMKAIVSDVELHEKYVDGFVQYLKDHCISG